MDTKRDAPAFAAPEPALTLLGPVPAAPEAANQRASAPAHAATAPELVIDLHDYGPRLRRLGIAALIGLALTFFSVKAMTSSGRGPNEDPVGVGSVGMLALAMFVLTTGFAHKILSRHRARVSA